MFPQEVPLVSVIVCTRNRGGSAANTIKAILASDYPDFEVWIIDQSDTDSTEKALHPLLEYDTRLRYRRLFLKGKPEALNAASRLVQGRYLVLTDDDCEPDSHWISTLINRMQAAPDIAAVFGEVTAGPHDAAAGYIAVNSVEAETTVRRINAYLKMPGMHPFGIGANMAVRRDALEAIGGWDPCIGPGTLFGSGDDHDLTVRLLRARYAVHFTPDACVTHHGFRRWEDSARNVERIATGFGVCCVKHLRLGTLYTGSLRMLVYFLLRIVWRAATFQRPLGIAFVRGWGRGFLAGMRHPIAWQETRFEPQTARKSLAATRPHSAFAGDMGLALRMNALVTLVRFTLNPWLEDVGAFSFYYVAIAVCAVHRGLRSALCSLFLGLLIADYLFLPPYYSFYFASSRIITKLCVYMLVGTLIAYFCQRRQGEPQQSIFRDG